MSNLFRKYKWLGIVFGVLLVIAGVLIIIFSITNKDKVSDILAIIVAVVCFVLGAIYIAIGVMISLNNFFDSSFIYGAFLIAIGVLLLIERSIVSEILVYTTSVALITFGAIYLIRAILYIANKMKILYIIIALLIAALAITFGILALCYKGQLLIVLYIVMGAIISVAGVIEIIYSIRTK